jgi:hypothetical protein
MQNCIAEVEQVIFLVEPDSFCNEAPASKQNAPVQKLIFKTDKLLKMKKNDLVYIIGYNNLFIESAYANAFLSAHASMDNLRFLIHGERDPLDVGWEAAANLTEEGDHLRAQHTLHQLYHSTLQIRKDDCKVTIE